MPAAEQHDLHRPQSALQARAGRARPHCTIADPHGWEPARDPPVRRHFDLRAPDRWVVRGRVGSQVSEGAVVERQSRDDRSLQKRLDRARPRRRAHVREG